MRNTFLSRLSLTFFDAYFVFSFCAFNTSRARADTATLNEYGQQNAQWIAYLLQCDAAALTQARARTGV